MEIDVARSEAGFERIRAAMTQRERNVNDSFFSGPAASAKAKNYLRVLLAKSADAELVADLRAYFNEARVSGDRIAAVHVSVAIRLLRG